MITVQRFDRGELRSAVRTPEGYYLAEAYVARPGVYEYLNADGSTRRELILPEELHHADSLATLARKPVTLEIFARRSRPGWIVWGNEVGEETPCTS